MDLAAAGLGEQPFPTHGPPLTLIPYAAHRAAIAALEWTCSQALGVAFLQGPPLSGKTTVLREFAERLGDDVSVAFVDGTERTTTPLLESVLRQFGYDVEYTSTNELLAMLRVFTLQQAARRRPPLIVVENAHLLSVNAVRAIGELAGLQTRQTSAIKLVLAAERPLRAHFESQAYSNVEFRVARDIHLRPLRLDEASGYLHAKLRAAGTLAPSSIFPQSICNEIWQAGGGWPGVMDRVSLLALARSESLPVVSASIERPAVPRGTWDSSAEGSAKKSGVNAPTLYVSKGGELIQQLPLHQTRLLIGRSEHNDLAIDSRYVSRHHMLLVRSGATTFLMDLNSTNGSFVNSRRVSNHVLIDNDIISLGHYRIKFSDPHAKQRGKLDGSELAATAIMKTLDDMRALLAREHTELIPAPTENLPTLGG